MSALAAWQVTFLIVAAPRCIVLVLYGLQIWAPSYLLRVHGMSLAKAGARYGVIALVAGSLGVLCGSLQAHIKVSL